ncbi:MAG: homoserine dehydrogenase [Actinobacteria bacterium]|mgnify:FL=1|nr:homoserine dehydrogenase [Actinomycetota bacterium]|tara:strand:- start:13025 stop:14287 length:1263 start_codon:yes stop_codon:yes gene_type:complete
MQNNTFSVAVLGAGNIGSAVLSRIEDLDNDVLNLKLKKVLVNDMSKDRGISKDLLTDSFDEIINDDSIDLVIEVLGGIDPGREYIKALLMKGKSVVTANKDIIADCGTDLIKIAQENNTCLYFEAAVAAGIPVLKPIIESLRVEELTKILGIINGTSNYILTSMEEGSTYEDALSSAKELGYAEPDPTNDVDGFDAKYKAMILSLLCFGVSPNNEDVFTEGISKITKDDFEWASRLNKTIKLVAQIDSSKEGINARVHPVLIDKKHPLASIRGALNALVVEGEKIDQLVFSGPGAGAEPTASSIIGDVLSACRQLNNEKSNWYPLREYKKGNKSFEDVESSLFIRLSVKDEPGVLAKIAGAFGENSVSIESVIQEGRGNTAELVIITHDAKERDLSVSVETIQSFSVIDDIASIIRVYSD